MPFLAGFVAGEGHFFIRPNNGNQSWACGFHLDQREDNAGLLVAARDLAGVGAIWWHPARNTSRPQVRWMVQSINECLALTGVLDGHPLLGKKAGDYRIWRMAVARWAGRDDGPRRWPHMAELARALRLHRQPDIAINYTQVSTSPWYRASFLAGFASAEGHFGVSQEGHPRFVIRLRSDDSEVLRCLASDCQVGRLISTPPTATASGQCSWLVTRLTELRALVETFDWNPPLGRSGRIYEAWRPIVLSRDRRAARTRLAQRLRETRHELESCSPTVGLPERESRRSRCLAVLKRWAADTDGPFTGTAYEKWSRDLDPTLPNRNTIARAFSSWRLALSAAGLSTKGCRSRNQVEAIRRAAAKRRAKQDPARRTAVLNSVARCATELGHRPTAAEYLRWRLQVDPGSPAQAAIYRLFPGGWAVVLSALDNELT